MNQPIDKKDEALLEATRNTVSRHQDIPPTPRDTLAILMEAAEKEAAATNGSRFSVFAWATGCAAALLIIAGTVWMLQTERPGVIVSTQSQNPVDHELGLDVAAWDMEMESLFDDLDESFLALSYDAY